MNTSTWLPTLIFVPLVGFALYRRFKTTFGRQRVAPRRMIARMVLLSVVSILLIATGVPTTGSMTAAGAGLVLGLALAGLGLRLTTFEVTSEGRFYVPSGWLGLTVTALFLGRLVARLFTVSERLASARAGESPLAGLQRSPLTVALFFLLAGYYVAFYAGILRRTRAA